VLITPLFVICDGSVQSIHSVLLFLCTDDTLTVALVCIKASLKSFSIKQSMVCSGVKFWRNVKSEDESLLLDAFIIINLLSVLSWVYTYVCFHRNEGSAANAYTYVYIYVYDANVLTSK
jgi:hypothetical protein